MNCEIWDGAARWSSRVGWGAVGVSREEGGLKNYGVGCRMVLGSCEIELGLDWRTV